MIGDDEADRLVKAVGKRAAIIWAGGTGTITQAIDAAFEQINPDRKAAVTRLFLAKLLDIPFEPVVHHRHRDELRVNPNDDLR